MGAYDPRGFMAAQHCDPEEAIRSMLAVGAKSALGMHWGTFQLTDEGRVDPERRLAEGLAARGLDPARFRALHPADLSHSSFRATRGTPEARRVGKEGVHRGGYERAPN